MSRAPSHLTTLPILLADAASLHTLFLLFAKLPDSGADPIGMLVWWSCLTVTYVLLARFLCRPRSLQGIAALSAGGFLAQLALSLLLGVRYPSLLSWICILIMWAGLYFQCCNALLQPLKSEQLIGAFERTAIALFISALAASGAAFTADAVFPPAIGLLLTLLALAQSRSCHPRISAKGAGHFQNQALLALFVAVLGGIAALCIFLFTDAAAGLLTHITQGLKAAGLSLLHALGRFFRWFVSLFPAPKAASGDLSAEQLAPIVPPPEGLPAKSDAGLYLLAGAVISLLLVFLFWHLRRGGIRRSLHTTRRGGHEIRTKRRLCDVFMILWRRLLVFFRFQYTYFIRRDTAPGLLVWLERKLHTRRLGREPGETARAFLLRVQSSIPQCQDALLRLADCLDAHYFGSGQVLSRQEIMELRRQLAAGLTSSQRHSRSKEPL